MSLIGGANLERRSTAELQVEAARDHHGWIEVKAEDFDLVDEHRLADRATGRIYRVVNRDVFGLGAIAINDGSYLWWATDSGPFFLEPETTAPTTLEEMQALQEEDRRLAQARADGYASFLRKQEKRQIRLADVRQRQLPSLREAAQQILDLAGEIVATSDGRLEVRVPRELSEPDTLTRANQEHELLRRCTNATTVLLAAKSVVVDALNQKDKRTLPERLPDVQVLADGGVA